MRSIRRSDMYRALGLKGSIIPKDMEGIFTVDVQAQWSYRGYQGAVVVKKADGSYAKHRIFIPCLCGRLVPFGRISQHKCK